MARPVRVRTSYAADATQLARIAQAIEQDPQASSDWKTTILPKLYEVSRMLTDETLRRVERDG